MYRGCADGLDELEGALREVDLIHEGVHLFSMQGSGFRVQGLGYRVQGSGFRVQGSGFGVQGLGGRVWWLEGSGV